MAVSSSHRLSHAVTKLFRVFKHKTSGSSSSKAPAMLMAGCLAPDTTTTLPATFFRVVKSAVEQQNAAPSSSSSGSRFSSSSCRSSATTVASPQSSINSFPGSGDALSVQMMEKLTLMLAAREETFVGTSSKKTKTVASQVLVETLLQLWDCVLPLLAAEDDSAFTQQVKQAAVLLVRAILARHEFDVVLNALASGGCTVHRGQESDGRKRRVSSVRLERRNSFKVVPATASSAQPPAKKSSRRNFLKKSKHHQQLAAPSLCLFARKYLELHQATLQFAEESLISKKKTAWMTQVHELLSELIAVSFIRIPFLWEKITDKLQPTKPIPSRTSSSADNHNSGRQSTMTMAIFKWQHTMFSKCNAEMAPFSREEFWYPSVHFLESVLESSDARMMICGNLIQHLTSPGSAWGRIEWKCIPGFPILVEQVMALTKTIFQSQVNALEQPAADDDEVEERVNSVKFEPKSPRMSALKENSPSAFFSRQSLTLLRENQSLIHPMLMTILKSTNYMLPHHVEICLQYLERLITEFPAYFCNEPTVYAGNNEFTIDTELTSHVFTCLLESEHFEILKGTELFLLKHFGAFSMTLRSALVQVFEAQFRHLFLHWNRDVRYCYYHILLYLTYPGNRIVLCARSDESILGAEASQLFEIHGLVRTAAMISWDVFDTPLHQMIQRYNRTTKQRKGGRFSQPASTSTSTSWVDAIPFTELARSVPEYKSLVQTYFHCAKQISIHEPVPTPAFHVKAPSHS
ncbi:Fatty acid amide hydrolase, partial [Globisporangium splendens]